MIRTWKFDCENVRSLSDLRELLGILIAKMTATDAAIVRVTMHDEDKDRYPGDEAVIVFEVEYGIDQPEQIVVVNQCHASATATKEAIACAFAKFGSIELARQLTNPASLAIS